MASIPLFICLVPTKMGCLLFICHPSYKLVPGIWLCSVLLPFSQLCLAASHHHFPLSEPSPKTFLFEMFSDLPLPSHPNHSPWNKYRTLQSVPRACQIQAIYAVVLAISHTNRSSPRYLLFFPSMHNIVFTQSWCSVHISLKCNVPESCQGSSIPLENIEDILQVILLLFLLTHK